MTEEFKYPDFGDYNRELEVSMEALKLVSPLSLKFRSELTYSSTFKKPDNSPVTIYDVILQYHMILLIHSRFPEDLIIAEESINEDSTPEFLEAMKSNLPEGADVVECFKSVRKTLPRNTKRYWAIDPIDGTSGFVKPPNGQYCNAIALLENHKPVFSAVSWPSHQSSLTNLPVDGNLFFICAIGHGSFVTNGVDYIQQVHVPADPPKYAIQPRENKRNIELIKQSIESCGLEYNPIYFSSMAKGFALAVGAGCVYIRAPFGCGYEQVYDIAPFSLFVQEAGAIATFGDGKEIVFTNEGKACNNSGYIFSSLGMEFHKKLCKEYLKKFHLDEE